MDFTITFLKLFSYGLLLAAPLLLALLTTIILLGQIVGRKERWERSDALYWSFVTATTLGYGDFRPTRKATKALAVAITLTGIVFTGITVAIALNATGETFKHHRDIEKIKSGIERITD